MEEWKRWWDRTRVSERKAWTQRSIPDFVLARQSSTCWFTSSFWKGKLRRCFRQRERAVENTQKITPITNSTIDHKKHVRRRRCSYSRWVSSLLLLISLPHITSFFLFFSSSSFRSLAFLHSVNFHSDHTSLILKSEMNWTSSGPVKHRFVSSLCTAREAEYDWMDCTVECFQEKLLFRGEAGVYVFIFPSSSGFSISLLCFFSIFSFRSQFPAL